MTAKLPTICTEENYAIALAMIEKLKRENSRLRNELAAQDSIIDSDMEAITTLANAREYARYGASAFDHF